jgi:hypothetical protein
MCQDILTKNALSEGLVDVGASLLIACVSTNTLNYLPAVDRLEVEIM